MIPRQMIKFSIVSIQLEFSVKGGFFFFFQTIRSFSFDRYPVESNEIGNLLTIAENIILLEYH